MYKPKSDYISSVSSISHNRVYNLLAITQTIN